MKDSVGSRGWQKYSWQKNSAGFAVLEALIAFVVLAAGLLALLSFFGTSQQAFADAKMRAAATSLAEARLQEIQGYLATSDPRVSSTGNGCDEPAPTLSLYGEFTRCWWVDDAKMALAPSDPDYSCALGSAADDFACWIAVVVDVSWVDRQANPQRVEVVSTINVRAPARGARDFLSLAMAFQNAGEPPQWLAGTEEGASAGGYPEPVVVEGWPHEGQMPGDHFPDTPGGNLCWPPQMTPDDATPGVISDDC